MAEGAACRDPRWAAQVAGPGNARPPATSSSGPSTSAVSDQMGRSDVDRSSQAQRTRRGRIPRNPVPSKLKGRTDTKQGNFAVMFMSITAPGPPVTEKALERSSSAVREAHVMAIPLDRADRAAAASPRQPAPSGSPSSAPAPAVAAPPPAQIMSLLPANPNPEGHDQIHSVPTALDCSANGVNHAPYPYQPGTAARTHTAAAEAAASKSEPLTPSDTKLEQARLLTLLRSLHPIIVVDHICKGLAYFGGIPGAPPPVDRVFPQSAKANGSGALFVSWLSEIFPDLSLPIVISTEQASSSSSGGVGFPAPAPLEPPRRPRGRPKGSKGTKARKDKGIKKKQPASAPAPMGGSDGPDERDGTAPDPVQQPPGASLVDGEMQPGPGLANAEPRMGGETPEAQRGGGLVNAEALPGGKAPAIQQGAGLADSDMLPDRDAPETQQQAVAEQREGLFCRRNYYMPDRKALDPGPSSDDDGESVDPTACLASAPLSGNQAGASGKRRGRPNGSRNRAKGESQPAPNRSGHAASSPQQNSSWSVAAAARPSQSKVMYHHPGPVGPVSGSSSQTAESAMVQPLAVPTRRSRCSNGHQIPVNIAGQKRSRSSVAGMMAGSQVQGSRAEPDPARPGPLDDGRLDFPSDKRRRTVRPPSFQPDDGFQPHGRHQDAPSIPADRHIAGSIHSGAYLSDTSNGYLHHEEGHLAGQRQRQRQQQQQGQEQRQQLHVQACPSVPMSMQPGVDEPVQGSGQCRGDLSCLDHGDGSGISCSAGAATQPYSAGMNASLGRHNYQTWHPAKAPHPYSPTTRRHSRLELGLPPTTGQAVPPSPLRARPLGQPGGQSSETVRMGIAEQRDSGSVAALFPSYPESYLHAGEAAASTTPGHVGRQLHLPITRPG